MLNLASNIPGFSGNLLTNQKAYKYCLFTIIKQVVKEAAYEESLSFWILAKIQCFLKLRIKLCPGWPAGCPDNLDITVIQKNQNNLNSFTDLGSKSCSVCRDLLTNMQQFFDILGTEAKKVKPFPDKSTPTHRPRQFPKVKNHLGL